MGTAFKTDVDAIAAAYLKNPVNNNINPYSSGWAPAYTNMALLDTFSGDPAESHPSGALPGTMFGNDIRNVMISLGQYYGKIAVGSYGLLTTDANGTRYTGQGVGYFVFNDAAPGIDGHFNSVMAGLNAVGTPSGTSFYQNVIDWYSYGWSIVNGHKNDLVVDLTVCHSSCHSNCHDSRGRR